MGSKNKIVGIHRDDANEIEIKEDQMISLGHEDESEEIILDESSAAEEEYWDEDYDTAPAPRNILMILSIVALSLLALGWTGFFAWANLESFQSLPSNQAIISLIGNWALPMCLIGLVWLLIMRNSTAESNRFADASIKLRTESEALEARMRTVNEEITMAREFLAQNALELESLGRQSAQQLTDAAEQLGIALADSDEKAKQLEQVSNSATGNLEQLRKHLPVVSSVAKDVTNHIGGAGNNAQAQVKSLMLALEKVTAAGNVAKASIANMDSQAQESSQNIAQQITASGDALTTLMVDTQKSTSEITAELKLLGKETSYSVKTASERLAKNAKNSSKELSAINDEMNAALEASINKNNQNIAATANTLNSTLEDNSAKLKAQLDEIAANLESHNTQSNDSISATAASMNELMETHSSRLHDNLNMLSENLSKVTGTVDQQDERVDNMISRVSSMIEESRQQIDQLDASATEKTSNLAFAIEALVQSTKDLESSIVENNDNADKLLENTSQLMVTLSEAREEIGTKMPLAVSSIGDEITNSLTQMENAQSITANMAVHSNQVVSRLNEIDELVESQRAIFENMMASSDEQLTSYREHAEIFTDSLQNTRGIVQELSNESEDQLLASLVQVGDKMEETAQRSKVIIEKELGDVAGRLSDQNKQQLDNAVNSQLDSINSQIQDAITKQLNLSQAATDKLTLQLSQIDEMTGNLERRLADTHDGFGGLDHEGFARRMAMLTESLNSTAIDVAKILSNDVTDTAWSSYLKGDRGVFTRRAVRLLDNGEARTIADHYEEDVEFAEHVNRYIHDFESMMRVLLSTRDGNAVGVTVLSSDVGKLYVALAQAIERLRS